MKVAIIGCGAIGSFIAEAIEDGGIGAEISYIYDVDRQRADTLATKVKSRIASSFYEILNSDVDIVIEAASKKAAQDILKRALPAGKSVLLMSIGALADMSFLEEAFLLAEKGNSRIYLPSGAVGALDALKSAREAGLEEVTLITTKPVQALMGALIDVKLEEIEEKTLLFEGNAGEAIKVFPQNVNVAIAISLSGIGVEKTKVKVFVDPDAELNMHEIYARGAFGSLYFKVENLPSPQNPKTSYLAALSAVATLRRISSRLKIGT